MLFEFDAAKSADNERRRGLSFAFAARLFESPRIEWEDRRQEYGEIRFSALGEIEGRIFFVAFTRRDEAIRIISFRKANPREARKYRQDLGARRAGDTG